ncbi:MAG: hypothetical protein LBI85_04495 [Spirochaetaceae bacterium]|jgi:hypothetical protein|nr:hypothetical protein [Spirochaetaceae bacterium]
MVCSSLLSCSYRELAAVSLDGTRLYALSRRAAGGRVRLSDFGIFEYELESPRIVRGEQSLEVRYRFSFEGGEDAGNLEDWENMCRLVLSAGEGSSWALPLSAAFLGVTGRSFSRLSYAVPIPAGELKKITLALEPKDSRAQGEKSGIFFELESFSLTPRSYGFSLSDRSLEATPFVYAEGESLVIDIPEAYRPPGGYELAAGGLSGPGEFFAAAERYAYLGMAGGGDFLVLPPGLLPPDPFPLGFRGGAASLEYRRGAEQEALEPVSIDPGLILDYPRESWRNSAYEIFRWDRFPGILIFDTADYAVQDRLFKRLAFFVEKLGFRGRLAPDSEIAALHGWNAHDYRSEDLARFFELARSSGFPLNRDEQDLEKLLLSEGILRGGAGGAILPGQGALVSVSRESAAYLRATFMVHETFHGLFFIDEEFREFSRRRWANFDPRGKRFITSYFEYSGYDSGDQYLMMNEFMAYCLQQGVSQAGEYFGKTLASRIAEHPRRRDSLPQGDEASGTWPLISSLFTSEAEAFSFFVRERFGLAAGRVRRAYKR